MYLVAFSETCSVLASVEKPEDQNIDNYRNLSYSFVWMYNSVSHSEGQTYTDVSFGVLRRILVPETYVPEACIYSLFNNAEEICVHVRVSAVGYPD